MSYTVFWEQGRHMIEGECTLRRYKALFGVTPLVASVIWSLSEHSRRHDSSPRHLLWGLMFLKVYATEHVHATFVGIDEKTFRKWCWIWVGIISELTVVCISHI